MTETGATTTMINLTYPMELKDRTLNGQEIPADYMKEAALAREAQALTGMLEVQDWRLILAAINSRMPVVIEAIGPKIGENRYTETYTAVIEYGSINERGGNLRVASWGFPGFNLHLSKIVSISTPEYSLNKS